MNIYVGNLSPELSEDDLRTAFAAFGTVSAASIVKDRVTGLPRGFGFVEMPDIAAAKTALSALNNKDLKGKAMTANEARPKGAGGFGMGGRGGFGGGKLVERKNRGGYWKGMR